MNEYEGEFAVSAHSDAAARLLLEVVRELRLGRAPEELGQRVILLGRVMARTI